MRISPPWINVIMFTDSNPSYEDDESGGDDENESFDGKDGTSNGVTGWFGRFNFFLGAHYGPRRFFAPYDIFTCLCYMFTWQT